MKVLALDTATEVLSAALSTGEGRWYTEADAGMRHSELLMGLADTLLKTAGIGEGELEGVLCMGGPGSFTGLRIGFAAAKGIALAGGIPWAAVPTLDCMALPHAPWPGLVVPAMDARKRSFFTALYRGGERVSAYMDAGAEEIAACIRDARAGNSGGDGPVLLTGPGGGALRDALGGLLPADFFTAFRLDPAGRRGYGRELLEAGLQRDILGKNPGGLYEGPLYLRKSDAELHLPGGGGGPRSGPETGGPDEPLTVPDRLAGNPAPLLK